MSVIHLCKCRLYYCLVCDEIVRNHWRNKIHDFLTRLVNIAIGTDTDTLLAILSLYQYCRYFLYGSIGSGIADTFSADFCRYSIPIQPEEEIDFLFNSYKDVEITSITGTVHCSVYWFTRWGEPYKPNLPKSTVAARMHSWQQLLTRGSSWIGLMTKLKKLEWFHYWKSELQH